MGGRRSGARAALVVWAGLTAALFGARDAAAHGTGLSYLELHVRGDRVVGALDVPGAEIARSLNVDADGDGALSSADLDAARGAIGRWLLATVRLVADGRLCTGEPGAVELQGDGLVVMKALWSCGTEVRDLTVATRFADTFGSGHATFMRATRDGIARQGLFDDRTTTLDLSFAPDAGSWRDAAGRYFVLGVEHIFGGIDHVLFLLSLILLGGSLLRVIGVATAFTAAHSITLSAAALGWAAPSSRLVESAIAASIAWVAIENLRHARPVPAGAPEPLALRFRWVLTFAFGLVHGFGFAGVLGELGLPQDHRVLALAAFNVGVEVGQVAILAAAWPLLARVQRVAWYRPGGVRYASLGVLALALYWFTERAFLS